MAGFTSCSWAGLGAFDFAAADSGVVHASGCLLVALVLQVASGPFFLIYRMMFQN